MFRRWSELDRVLPYGKRASTALFPGPFHFDLGLKKVLEMRFKASVFREVTGHDYIRLRDDPVV